LVRLRILLSSTSVVLAAGSVSVIAGVLLRNYGRHHERRPRARGRRLIR
jgi:hypothetical protein